MGGSHQNIATLFGTEKLEWCGYPMVKKFRSQFEHLVSTFVDVKDRFTVAIGEPVEVDDDIFGRSIHQPACTARA